MISPPRSSGFPVFFRVSCRVSDPSSVEIREERGQRPAVASTIQKDSFRSRAARWSFRGVRDAGQRSALSFPRLRAVGNPHSHSRTPLPHELLHYPICGGGGSGGLIHVRLEGRASAPFAMISRNTPRSACKHPREPSIVFKAMSSAPLQQWPRCNLLTFPHRVGKLFVRLQ